MEFTCKNCGKVGSTFPSQPRTFCSRPCASQWNAKHGPMPTKPRRGHSEPCEHCGTPVYRSKGQASKRFCSVACAQLGQRNGAERPCEHCGSPMYVVPSGEAKRFCGRECYEAARTVASATGRQHNGREVIRDHSGYLRTWEPDHPASNQGRVLEHRWVMEQALGRHLTTEEHVHHVNGVKDDNRIDNLQVMDAQEHRLLTAAEIKSQRASEAAELAEYRKRYGPLVN